MKALLVIVGLAIIFAAIMTAVRRTTTDSANTPETASASEIGGTPSVQPTPEVATPRPATTPSTTASPTPKVRAILPNSKLEGSALDQPATRGLNKGR